MHMYVQPDISAPGVNILAAWSPMAGPTVFPDDNRSVEWNMESGTSMSCPHVSAVLALIKSAYPHWSPAAIKSAILTTGIYFYLYSIYIYYPYFNLLYYLRKFTAYTHVYIAAYNTDIFGHDITVEASEKSADPFDMGSGHINPLKALDPGLIYNTTTADYVTLLCNMGYSQTQIQSMLIPCTTIRCPDKVDPDWNVNYPSISVPDLTCTITLKRTLTNVGRFKTAVYFISSLVKPHGVDVVVWPKVLVFSPFKVQITYHVTITPLKRSVGRYDFGSITWSDGFYHVRTPLLVQLNTTHAPLITNSTPL